MSTPVIKGWCPGAHRPMVSGDGLLVRIRPAMGRMTTSQILGFCAAASQFGNGLVDLTSRSSLQIRGVQENRLEALQSRLRDLDLLDPSPEIEHRRNILTTPVWQEGDLTTHLHGMLVDRLPDLPELPAKMGVVLDTGPFPILHNASGDFRFERDAQGDLVLRADTASRGQRIAVHDAFQALKELMHWFLQTGGADRGRMARHLLTTALPARFQAVAPMAGGPFLRPGDSDEGAIYGVRFGQMQAQALADLATQTQTTAMRLTPWRMIVLEQAMPVPHPDFTLDPDDPALRIHACPGAPACLQAKAPTRALAEQIAQVMPAGQSLHVSGCAKGCAHPKPADVTLVAEGGKFNLVPSGRAWDEPSRCGLSPAEATDLFRR